MYHLLSGERPFDSQNTDKLRRDTLDMRYSMRGSRWEDVTDSAKDLVGKLLTYKDERLTAEQALAHEWFSITE